jgi:hypothetical protein
VYLEGQKFFHTFISNVAIPKGGTYSGDMEDLQTGERRREVFQVVEGVFIPSLHNDYQKERIYQFSFDAEEACDLKNRQDSSNSCDSKNRHDSNRCK